MLIHFTNHDLNEELRLRLLSLVTEESSVAVRQCSSVHFARRGAPMRSLEVGFTSLRSTSSLYLRSALTWIEPPMSACNFQAPSYHRPVATDKTSVATYKTSVATYKTVDFDNPNLYSLEYQLSQIFFRFSNFNLFNKILEKFASDISSYFFFLQYSLFLL